MQKNSNKKYSQFFINKFKQFYKREERKEAEMYGQKQILQCLAVAIVLAVLNFHRAAIKRSKSISKSKIRRPGELRPKNRQMFDENIPIFNHNLTGYCMRYPFGQNTHGNHDTEFVCHHICFAKFETWLHKQCSANCCIHKSYEASPRKKSVQNPIASRPKATHYCENALIEYMLNGAGQSHPHELVKTIIKPINKQLVKRKRNKPNRAPEECKIETIDELICKITTSATTVHRTKLETNKTENIMDYHDFLFDMGVPESKLKPPSSFGNRNQIIIE